MTLTEAERDCKHGQLARSCNVCELEAEIERLQLAVALKNGVIKKLQDEANDARLEIERKDALLCQASELLHRQWSCSAVWSLEEAQDLDAAIKQHLGEV